MQCIKCNKIFNSNRNLQRHLDRKIKCDRVLECYNCKKKFKTIQNLNKHLNNKKKCEKITLETENKILKLEKEILKLKLENIQLIQIKQIPNNNFSKLQILWLNLLSKLNNIHIQHAVNDSEYKIPNTRYYADGYCKETNTIYEFHGDYWHGCPKRYNPNALNQVCNKTFKELYENTLKKEQTIKDLGYNLVVIWESDWNKINTSIKKLQIKFRKCFINM